MYVCIYICIYIYGISSLRVKVKHTLVFSITDIFLFPRIRRQLTIQGKISYMFRLEKNHHQAYSS